MRGNCRQALLGCSGLIGLLILAVQQRISVTANEAAANEEPLSVPVAFPIFRPPLATVQRQKSSAEHIRPPLRFHSLTSGVPSQTNSSEIEEISAPSDSFSSPEEEEDTSSQQKHSEHFAFSSVPTLTVQLGRVSDDQASRNNGTGTKAKTKGPMKMNKARMENIPEDIPSTTSIDLGVERGNPTSRILMPQASSARPTVVSIINTPQFPVFTGMGMEIIDSQERNAESASTVSSHANLEENNTNERDRMHYNRAGNNTADNSTSSPIHLSTLDESKIGKKNVNGGQTTTELAMPSTTSSITSIPLAKTDEKVPIPSKKEGLSKSVSPLAMEKKDSEAFKTEPSILLTTTSAPPFDGRTTQSANDEVTEDLLAILNNQPQQRTLNISNSLLLQKPAAASLPASAESNIDSGDFHHSLGVGLSGGKDELDAGFERQTQIAGNGATEQQMVTTARPTNEAILTRPTRPPAPKQPNFVESSSTTTETPPKNYSATRVFTRFPLLWTSSSTTQKPATDATSTVPSNGFGQNWQPISTGNNGQNIHDSTPPFVHWGRISPSAKTAATTTDWPMSNHLETEAEPHWSSTDSNQIGVEETNPTAVVGHENDQLQQSKSSDKNAVNQENEDKNEGRNELTSGNSSKYSTSTSSQGNMHLRNMLFIGAVVFVLLITIAVGSVCTARYVKKSRQLHGKYRPAAYEMQTQQRFQPDFIHSQQIQQQHMPSMQQQTAIFNGKEERLI